MAAKMEAKSEFAGAEDDVAGPETVAGNKAATEHQAEQHISNSALEMHSKPITAAWKDQCT